jgi:hypothetical protein
VARQTCGEAGTPCGRQGARPAAVEVVGREDGAGRRQGARPATVGVAGGGWVGGRSPVGGGRLPVGGGRRGGWGRRQSMGRWEVGVGDASDLGLELLGTARFLYPLLFGTAG